MKRLCLSVLLISLLTAPWAGAEFLVETVAADQWGQPDDLIGLTGGTVENFEDTLLASGLFFEIAGLRGSLTGTGSNTLPNVFDPVNGDPYGSSFSQGVWDGSRVLVNTVANQSQNYGSQDWRAVAFYVPGGAAWIAVACQQVTVNHTLRVNGLAVGQLSALGLDLGPGRNGVLIVRSDDPADPVTSVSFGGGGDAFVLDHVVFLPSGTVAAEAASWGGIKALYRD